MKNVFVERRKREIEWNDLTPEERQIITHAYQSKLHPGIDQEEIRENFISRGTPPIEMLKTIIEWEKDGSNYMMVGE